MECSPAVRVLLVDDDRDGANSTAMLLRHFGAEVRAVYDSRLACDEALLFEPDLMLIDLSMPHLNGCAVARQLRSAQQFSATPLAVVSGHTDAERRAACAAAGFNEYLVKPVPLELLVRLLQEIRTAKARGEAARGRSPSEIQFRFIAMEAANQ
jgi:two-component system OmpR family response regulator